MNAIEPAVVDAAGRRLRVVALLVLAVCGFGIFACDYLVASGMTQGESRTQSVARPFAVYEPPFLWLLAAFAVVTWALGHRRVTDPPLRLKRSLKPLAGWAMLGATAVATIGVVGAVVMRHATPQPALFLNPLFGAISVLSLAGTASRLWPGDSRRGRWAVLYLATSAQLLLVSMSETQLAPSLCVNLLWLYLVLRDDRFGLSAAPWIGVAALALPNPLAHAFVAAPFLIRVLRTGRIGWIGYYAAVYGLGAVALSRAMSWTLSNLDGVRPIGEWGIERYFAQGMNLAALLTWQAPAAALFLVAAVVLVRSLKPAERDLLTGLLLTIAFYAVVGASGDHALGYREAFPVLGSAALLAASATASLAAQRGGTLVSRLVVASTVVAIALQLPLRAKQAEDAARRPSMPVDRSAPATQPGFEPSASPRGRSS